MSCKLSCKVKDDDYMTTVHKHILGVQGNLKKEYRLVVLFFRLNYERMPAPKSPTKPYLCSDPFSGRTITLL